MPNQPGLIVQKSALLCALGSDAASVASALQAGVSRCQDSGIYLRNLVPVKLAVVPAPVITPALASCTPLKKSLRYRRILSLLLLALPGFQAEIPANTPVIFLITLPENFPDYTSDLGSSLLKSLAELGPFVLDAQSQAIRAGSAGAGILLQKARDILSRNPNAHIIVAGADSCVDIKWLTQLDKQRRLVNRDAMDAFVPGEALAAVKVAVAPIAASANLYGLANTMEEGHMFSEAPYKGNALASAATQSLQLAESSPVQSIYTNLNGESFFVKEFGVTLLRNQKYLCAKPQLYHPAEYYGDIGAASFLAQIIIALQTPQQESLILASSWLGPRASVMVRARA